MSKPFFGRIHHSWTQPYNLGYINNFNPPMSKEELKTQQELSRWERVDKQVDAMDEYPDAIKIIRNIMR